MVEILTGDRFSQAVDVLCLASASKTFSTQNFNTNFQVWSLEEPDFQKLCFLDENDWKPEWSWWRCAEGSNLGAVLSECLVNGVKLKVWKAERICYRDVLTYLAEEIGATTEKNICATCIDLARQNGMNLSSLFKTYLPTNA